MHRSSWKIPFALACLIGFSLFPSADGQAEPYVAVQGGYVFPKDLYSVQGKGLNTGTQFTNLSVDNTYIYGARAGYVFADPQESGVGFEFEVNNSSPVVNQQATVSSRVGPTLINGNRLRLTTTALNVTIRTSRIGRFQPYGGVGPAVFFAKDSSPVGSHGFGQDATLGLNAFAGVRFFLKDRISLFGEYKYNLAKLHFENFFGTTESGARFNYSANILLAGLAYHF